MGHKYLEELQTYQGPRWGIKQDSRMEEWDKEKEIYGFDSTETWALDTSFYLWLYEHLRMYLDKASEIVNLHFHTFWFKGHAYYQDELIEEMLDRLRFYFSEAYDEYNEEDYTYVSEILEIWATILPAMWW